MSGRAAARRVGLHEQGDEAVTPTIRAGMSAPTLGAVMAAPRSRGVPLGILHLADEGTDFRLDGAGE